MGSNEGTLLIRDAAEGDGEVIRAVALAAYEQYADTLPKKRWEAYRESIAGSVDGDGPEARIVAELNGEIVGSVLLFISSEKAYGKPELGIDGPIIRLLSVAPSARGKGVATALIQECVRRARTLGAAYLHLHTSAMMASAVKLYERLGFERAPDKDFQNGETHVLHYRLNLTMTALLKPAGKHS
ncbi:MULTISPECIES: GNAT family N-acetyltransferase [Paenibacillus]|uniref:GNAT family N-acetyltransferase n=1 Tax=Paenibacillus validus TaxID=44253 RepID=A0A7X3CRR2_9BACL|nr:MULTISPECIES: GNAT family N-acetyltransferase [Paenibacillus]MUG69971.1 GNAT family N-acetyltransferase [Paenibacillus validus]